MMIFEQSLAKTKRCFGRRPIPPARLVARMLHMMQIRTTSSRTSPLVRLEETIRHDMVISHDDIGECYISRNTHTVLSTGLRLAVVLPKHSNAKGWRDIQCLESVQSLQCNAQRSLTAVRSSASASLSLSYPHLVGGQPTGGRGHVI